MFPEQRRPFYGTIWFNALATLAVGALIIAIWLWADPERKNVPGAGQFGVVLVAVYWALVFPKLRKIRVGGNAPQPGKR